MAVKTETLKLNISAALSEKRVASSTLSLAFHNLTGRGVKSIK